MQSLKNYLFIGKFSHHSSTIISVFSLLNKDSLALLSALIAFLSVLETDGFLLA